MYKNKYRLPFKMLNEDLENVQTATKEQRMMENDSFGPKQYDNIGNGLKSQWENDGSRY